MSSLIKRAASRLTPATTTRTIIPLLRTLANVAEAGDNDVSPTSWRASTSRLSGEGWSLAQRTQTAVKEPTFFSTAGTNGEDVDVTDLFRNALPKATEREVGYLPGPIKVLERQNTATIAEILLDQNAENFNYRFALTGAPGCGKTTALSQICAQCHTAGWVVAHVPDASKWTNELQDIENSEWKEGRIDQFQQAQDWLEYFLTWNADKIQDMKLVGSYNWEAMSLNSPESLKALSEKGAEDGRISTDVVGIVLKELTQNHRVLLAVDVFNAWRHTPYTEFLDFEGVPVSLERASLIRHFIDAIENQFTVTTNPNFAVIVAESSNGGAVKLADLEDKDRVSFSKAEFCEFNEFEMKAMAESYFERQLTTKRVDTKASSFAQITGGNPKKVHAALLRI